MSRTRKSGELLVRPYSIFVNVGTPNLWRPSFIAADNAGVVPTMPRYICRDRACPVRI